MRSRYLKIDNILRHFGKPGALTAMTSSLAVLRRDIKSIQSAAESTIRVFEDWRDILVVLRTALADELGGQTPDCQDCQNVCHMHIRPALGRCKISGAILLTLW